MNIFLRICVYLKEVICFFGFFFKEYEDILFSKFKIYFIICVSILYFIYGIGLKFLNMILCCVLFNINFKNVI